MCSNIMISFKQVCDEIGMPISPEKAVRPVQVIQFLGLTIDTILMVVQGSRRQKSRHSQDTD